jgi:radical SAM protein with 4Fe4S-binding SPASM domain
MSYFLSSESVLKKLEVPAVYNIKSDDLYELDGDSFQFLQDCASDKGCESADTEFIHYCLRERILTETQAPRKHPSLTQSPVPSLRYLELQITDKCNLRCGHCYIADKGSSELPVHQIRIVLREFEEMQGLRVLITGGEPLLHSGFDAVNQMLPEFSLRKILFTNGLLLNKKVLMKLNVEEIQISIDGLEDAHDSLRGKGSFKAAMNAARRALDSGYEVSVATMVHPGNLKDFDKMERLFREMGIRDWTVDIPCFTGRLKAHPEFRIGPARGGRYLRYGFGKGLHSGATGYACGVHLMAVMADGTTAKCTFYADPSAGRIEEGLRECWRKIKPVTLDELTCDCEYLEHCRGGCRYRAFLFGDALGRDPYRCSLYGIMNK